MKYYDLRQILKKDATYNVIIGQRSNGKTYALLKHAVNHYFKSKKQFAIIRRWGIDVKASRASEMFSAINADNIVFKASKGEYSHIAYNSRKFYSAVIDENGKFIYSDNDVCGYIFSLSDMEHDKSISFPNVDLIIFDEFLSIQHNYLFNEFNVFMNVISTIVRNRGDVKIFMLGNTVDKYSPYFSNMGLNHITEQKQGTIDLYTYGDNSQLKVAVEYCENVKKSKDNNNFYFAFDNPHLQMIKNGTWDLGIYPQKPLAFKNSDIQFIFFIIYNDNVYQCEIIFVNDYNFIYIHEKSTEIKDPDKDVIYCLDYVPKYNYTQNMLKPIYKVNQKILWYFLNNRVYYQNNNVGNAINSYIEDCKREDFSNGL